MKQILPTTATEVTVNEPTVVVKKYLPTKLPDGSSAEKQRRKGDVIQSNLCEF